MIDFKFYGFEKVRDLAGRFRTLEASGFYDFALNFIVADQAERMRVKLVLATPVRRGVTAASWKVGHITKSRVRVYTTEGQTVDDLIHGTLDKAPIVPSEQFLKWKDTRPGMGGVYFRPQVAGQAPNLALAAAVHEVQYAALDTQVIANRISDATRKARL